MDFTTQVATAVQAMQKQVSVTRAEYEAAKAAAGEPGLGLDLAAERMNGRVQGQREMLVTLAACIGIRGDDWYQRLQEWADEETERYVQAR